MQRYETLTGKALLLLVLLWFFWFMNFVGRTMFAPILPLIEDEFGVTHARASSLFFFLSVGSSVSLLSSDVFIRFLGPRKSIMLSAIGPAVIYCLVPFVRDFKLLYVLSLMLGFTIGVYLPSVIPLMTEYFHEKVWSKAFAIHDSGASIAIFVVPFLALLILSFLPWRGIFVILALVSLVCAFIFFGTVKGGKPLRGSPLALGRIWRTKAFWVMSVLFTCASGTSLGLYYILPLYLVKELGMPVDAANTVFGFSRIGGAAVAISAGFFVDRFSIRKTMFGVVLANGFLVILLAVSGLALLKAVLFVQASIVIGFFPVGFISIARMFEHETRGQVTGFILTFATIFGSGMIPYLLGLSGDLLSFRFGIGALGIMIVAVSGLPFLLKELK